MNNVNTKIGGHFIFMALPHNLVQLSVIPILQLCVTRGHHNSALDNADHKVSSPWENERDRFFSLFYSVEKHMISSEQADEGYIFF